MSKNLDEMTWDSFGCVTYAPRPLTPVSPMSKRGGVISTTAPNVTRATRDDYEGKELQSLTL